MKLQLIRSAHMQTAMSLVMDRLGPDALIYRTKTSSSGVEILAGLPDENEEFQSIENSINLMANEGSMPLDNVQNQLNQLGSSIREITKKIQLLSKNSSMAEKSHNNQAQLEDSELFIYLLTIGFSKQSIYQLFSALFKKIKPDEDIREAVQKFLLKNIKISKKEIIFNKRICALVGPTGAGKTTSIVKMAIRYLQKFGKEKIGVITTDKSEISIKNTLSHYCNELGIDLEYVSSSSELKNSINRMQHKKLILIDTHGVNQRDHIAIMELINMLEYADSSISVYLTLQAQQQESVIEDIIAKFNSPLVQGCVITKMDEAINLAPVISAVAINKLMVNYICHGQDVQCDMYLPEKSTLLSYFYGPQTDNTEEDELEIIWPITAQMNISTMNLI